MICMGRNKQTSLISALLCYLDSSGLINLLILLVFGTSWSNVLCAILLAINPLLICFIVRLFHGRLISIFSYLVVRLDPAGDRRDRYSKKIWGGISLASCFCYFSEWCLYTLYMI